MTTFLSGFITPLIAIITASILVLQYILAKRRWRLDLYDKRFPVYLATMEYISSIMSDTTATEENLFKFLRNSKDKEFLFGKDIQEYLKSFYEKGVQLNLVTITLQDQTKPVGEQRKELLNGLVELLKWFGGQFEESKKLFGKYLKIDKK